MIVFPVPAPCPDCGRRLDDSRRIPSPFAAAVGVIHRTHHYACPGCLALVRVPEQEPGRRNVLRTEIELAGAVVASYVERLQDAQRRGALRELVALMIADDPGRVSALSHCGACRRPVPSGSSWEGTLPLCAHCGALAFAPSRVRGLRQLLRIPEIVTAARALLPSGRARLLELSFVERANHRSGLFPMTELGFPEHFRPPSMRARPEFFDRTSGGVGLFVLRPGRTLRIVSHAAMGLVVEVVPGGPFPETLHVHAPIDAFDPTHEDA